MINSEKMTLQTSWNMEMPYEMMLGLKKKVPTVVEMVSTSAVRMNTQIRKYAVLLKRYVQEVEKQGRVMFKRAVHNFAAVNPSRFLTTVTDKTVLFLKAYQKKVQVVLDAVVKFLRETKFQVPGYNQRLSGLEVYQKFSGFVADVTEETIQKVPEYFSSMFRAGLDYFEAIEFIIPGSNRVVRGREILADLSAALRKVQDQVIIIVRKVGEIKLEDIMRKFSAFMQFTVEQGEKFLQTLKSQNRDELLDFVTDMYNDAVNSPVLADVSRQIEASRRIIMEYLAAVKAKLQSILADISTEQLQADIQSWIDFFVKRVNAFNNNVIQTLQSISRNVEPFVRVSQRQIEIDIPFSFLAKSN